MLLLRLNSELSVVFKCGYEGEYDNTNVHSFKKASSLGTDELAVLIKDRTDKVTNNIAVSHLDNTAMHATVNQTMLMN